MRQASLIASAIFSAQPNSGCSNRVETKRGLQRGICCTAEEEGIRRDVFVTATEITPRLPHHLISLFFQYSKKCIRGNKIITFLIFYELIKTAGNTLIELEIIGPLDSVFTHGPRYHPACPPGILPVVHAMESFLGRGRTNPVFAVHNAPINPAAMHELPAIHFFLIHSNVTPFSAV